jgi:hypothetical protein
MHIDWQAIHDQLPYQDGPEAEARREVCLYSVTLFPIGCHTYNPNSDWRIDRTSICYSGSGAASHWLQDFLLDCSDERVGDLEILNSLITEKIKYCKKWKNG